MNPLVMLVALAAVGLYGWTGFRVGRGRYKYGIHAPAMTGSPEFERLVRVQMNTLEWLPMFLVGLWAFAATVEPRVAAAIGVVWLLGRLLYAVSYAKDPAKRAPGFLIQAAACTVLLLGGGVGAGLRLLSGG